MATKPEKPPIDKKATLQKVSEAVTEKPVKITIDVRPKTRLHAWLIKQGIRPAKRNFEVRPQRVINIYRIAGRAEQFEVEAEGLVDLIAKDRIGTLMKIMRTRGEDIFYIVAAALQNDHREPTKKMLDIVRNEFEMQDLFTVLNVTVANYNIQDFLNSIALIVGTNALSLNDTASPNVKGS